MDQLNDAVAAKAAAREDIEFSELSANENVSKVIAYTSQYMFWVTVIVLSAGYLLIR